MSRAESPSSQTSIEGTRVLPGSILEATDFYVTEFGRIESCWKPGTILRKGEKEEWIRPSNFVALLAHFAVHRDSCGKTHHFMMERSFDETKECTCGLSGLLSKLGLPDIGEDSVFDIPAI
jgi:hypothetical protein